MTRPKGAGAVMAQKAKKEVETDTPQQRLHRQLNFFPTPPWATRAGIEQLKRLDPAMAGPNGRFHRVIREPAAGELHMVGPLQEEFENVVPSDVYPHGKNVPVLDWLDDPSWPDEPDCDWIFTNPPFDIADQFVIRGMRRARRGVALLLRLSFLEGGERYNILAGEERLTQVAIFSERVPMVLGRWEPGKGTATAYGWFFWMHGEIARPPVWFRPGTRDRLWKPDDAERYGYREPMTLFETLTDPLDA